MAEATEAKLGVQDKLIEALGEIDRPGTVCTAGDLPLTMPGLEVEGLGAVRLPLGSTQARKLIKRCRQAPYGKGTETLVDTSVRRVRELDPEQFELTNPKWHELMAEILGRVQHELGLEKRPLAAHLYKLLVYEAGSFFLPHRDGEKLDRMVGTLVVGLPSVHEGGELIVSHDGRQHKIAFRGAASGHELSYAAFYADCRHEIRPLTSGHRLCLVYNMTLARSRGKRGLSAPTSRSAIGAITELLTQWREEQQSQKLAVTLDHSCTQDALTLEMLKGVDRARADVLFAAAEQAGCVAHLALITQWLSGAAEGIDYGYSRYGRRRNHWYDDEDDDDYADDASSYEMGEIYDSSLSASHWSDRNGKKVSLGEMPLEAEEIVSQQPLDEWDATREEFEGYTGNAGMTLERWYHRAAIVIWSREQHFAVLCGAGTAAAVADLRAMVKQLRRTAKTRRQEQRQSCLDYATAIIATWRPNRRFWPTDEADSDRSAFLPMLEELDEPALVQRFLAEVMPGDGEIQIGKTFPAFCKRHGWPGFKAALAEVMAAASSETVLRNALLLENLCLQRDKNADRLTLCQHLSEQGVAALEKFDEQPERHHWRLKASDRARMLVALVKSMQAVDAGRPLARLIDHALSHEKIYDLSETHLAAIYALQTWWTGKSATPQPAISHWLAQCRAALESRVAEPPVRPTDARRAADLSCKCAECQELSGFLMDPEALEHRFRVRQERRDHLAHIIHNNHCDLKCTTERRGTPHSLVCTKTTASYEAALEMYERDKVHLARLRALEARIA